MSLHQFVIPTFEQMLGSMEILLDKAKAHCQAKKIDEAVLLQFRLYPDMFPLVRQVQSAADHASSACLRLSGKDATNPPRDETTFDALRQRVSNALQVVKGVSASDMDAHAERELPITMGPRHFVMLGRNYVLHLALPNFWFHHTTAYAILRHNGVEIGKRDYLGHVPGLPQS